MIDNWIKLARWLDNNEVKITLSGDPLISIDKVNPSEIIKSALNYAIKKHNKE